MGSSWRGRRSSQHNSNVETPSKANTCVVSREKQKISRHKSLDPDRIRACMCTCARITYSRGPAEAQPVVFCQVCPPKQKQNSAALSTRFPPPPLSIECIRYLHSTLPFKPVVLSNYNVSHISILFPGIFFPW